MKTTGAWSVGLIRGRKMVTDKEPASLADSLCHERAVLGLFQILASTHLAHVGCDAPLLSFRYGYDWMREFAMRVFDRMPSENLDRREMHLILLAGSAIIVLAAGLALFMYPIVFSQTALVPARTMSVAFIGFCALSILLAVYL